jgi:hypothetical protein
MNRKTVDNLTNETMAEALVKVTGMKLVTAYRCVRSLDAITAEIEARGLWWEKKRTTEDEKERHKATVGDFKNPHASGSEEAKTAPLALCAALLSYLSVAIDDAMTQKPKPRRRG